VWDAIATYEDVLDDPQALANGYIAERELPGVGVRKVVGNLIKLSKTPGTTKASWPELGQQTEEVLLELGYEWDEITEITEQAREALRQKFIDQGQEPPV
jgi:formyl-CoA transferase